MQNNPSKIVTSRAFRQHHLHRYGAEDFDTFSEYFLYLHLNPRVQFLHALGYWVSLPFFPWSLKKLWKEKNPWPFLGLSALFYGTGFAAHWTEDGQVSKTITSFFPTYREALIMNWRVLNGSQKNHEEAFKKKYPHVLWVFFKNAPPPEGGATDVRLVHGNKGIDL